MNQITKLAEKANDSFMASPEDVLKDALEQFKPGGKFENNKKVLVLTINEDDGNYSVSFIQSQMKMSECVALSEVAKTIFLSQMNYIKQD